MNKSFKKYGEGWSTRQNRKDSMKGFRSKINFKLRAILSQEDFEDDVLNVNRSTM